MEPTQTAPGTLVEVGTDGDMLIPEERERHGDQTAGEWIKANLFNSAVSGVITVILGGIGVYLGYRAAVFVGFTARWEPVRANLELFMIGLFPRAERARLITQALMFTGGVGMLVGYMRQRSIRIAEQAGIEPEHTTLREYAGTYWAVTAFVLFSMIIGVRTIDPWLLLLGCFVSAATGYLVTLRPTVGTRGIALALAPVMPLAIVGVVLTLVQDLNNTAAYTLAAILVGALAVVQYAQRPALTLSAGLLLCVAGFQVLSGTHGLSWVYLTAAAAPIVLDLVGSRTERLLGPTAIAVGVTGSFVVLAGGVFLVAFIGFGLISAFVVIAAIAALVSALRRDPGIGMQLGALTVTGVAMWAIGRFIGIDGIDWKDWGGLHLNLVVAAATTILAFPLGLLLALGRRSSLPVLRWLCTAYIELFRGVPLITLLFMAQFFVGFFLNGNDLPLVTKSTIVFTLFSSAYIAEIVRGGLQSVAKGQTEAGQAMGMSPAAITRLLILPQALKAVIPAMVGQFISLFKDTSLLSVIGIPEFLGVREIVHAQAEFRGFGIAETLVFVAFGFWAFSFTMSRESQRLERRLDTGNR